MIDYLPQHVNHSHSVAHVPLHPAPNLHHYVHVYVHPYHVSHSQEHLPVPLHLSYHAAHALPHPYGYPHDHGLHGDQSHIIHITIYTHHSDVTKTVWMWHITNHQGELVKVSSEVHKTLIDCVINIGEHKSKLAHLEETEVSNTKWTWRISRHDGHTIKSSDKFHVSLKSCLADLQTTGSSAH
jgi:hypothetical protein